MFICRPMQLHYRLAFFIFLHCMPIFFRSQLPMTALVVPRARERASDRKLSRPLLQFHPSPQLPMTALVHRTRERASDRKLSRPLLQFHPSSDTAGSAPPSISTTCTFASFSLCSQELVPKVIGGSASN